MQSALAGRLVPQELGVTSALRVPLVVLLLTNFKENLCLLHLPLLNSAL
jgi:hypothetical protein